MYLICISGAEDAYNGPEDESQYYTTPTLVVNTPLFISHVVCDEFIMESKLTVYSSSMNKRKK